MSAKIHINADEHELISGTDFFIRKKKITEKLSDLLSSAREGLAQVSAESGVHFPEQMDLESGKLSRGENYKGLPYLVFDFPKYFSKQSIFAYRSMFWWGNEFSFHIILCGEAWLEHRSLFSERIELLKGKDFYISVHSNPWDYRFMEEVMMPVDEYLSDRARKAFIKDMTFLKLSRKLDFDQVDKWETYSCEGWKLFLQTIRK